MRNVRLGSLQATRPNSRKRCLGRACEKAEPQQVLCPSHCETVAGKMPKRRCWNPLKRERNRAQTMRNRSQKTAETLLLDPTKKQRKNLQATRPNSRKRCLGRACEKAEPQQVLCPSHCETAAEKMPKRRCRNPLERKEYMPKPCETAARKLPKRCFWNLRKMPKRCFWNLLKTKKRLPQARQTFAQRKTWKPASHPCSSHAKQQDSCSSRARQVPHRSTTIFCNNFLGALPLTATRGRRIMLELNCSRLRRK